MNRRSFLAVASASCCGAVAGCLGDEAGSDDDHDRQPIPPKFEIEDVVESDPVGLSVDLREYTDPFEIDIVVGNASTSAHTFEFDGFRPFPEPWAIDDNGVRRLVLVPGDGSPVSYEDEYLPDEPPEDHYWEPTRPVERPDGERSVTLDPGESIGGTHLLLAAHGTSKLDVESRGSRPLAARGASKPSNGYPRSGRFESEIGVPTADVERVEIGFTFDVDVAAY